MKKRRKSKIRYSKIVITSILIFLVLYTVSVLVLVQNGHEEPDILTGCVFGFCGTEGGLLALIKCIETKCNKNIESKEETENED